MSTPTLQIIEENRTLSQCRLWPMIEEYYGTAGPDAWNETPYYPTSNAGIAETYAELIVAFLRDQYAEFDPDEPIYIMELAAGSGAFSFFLLQALQEKRSYFAALRDLRLCYVMTDFAESTIASWEAEPLFQPYREAGTLDFALFWPELQDSLALRRSGITLDRATVRNPVVAIANYFFDSIRQDYFQFEQGEIREARVTLCRELNSLAEMQSPPRLAQIQIQDRYVPVASDYYPDPEWNALLRYYRENLPMGSALFPVGALQTLRHLRTLSGERLLLLAADKGFHTLEYLRGHTPTPYTPHTGSFSYMVNFHALGRYFENLGGCAWHAQENHSLTTMVGMSFRATSRENLAYAADTLLERSNRVRNTYQLSSLLEYFLPRDDCPDAELLKNAIACVQFSHYDPWIFGQCGEYLCRGLNGQEYASSSVLSDLLHAVEQHLHPAAVGCQRAFGYLRRLYYLVGENDACLAVNEKATGLYGPERDSFFYPAAIAESRGDYPSARDLYRQALACDPESDHARAGITRMDAILG